MHAARCCDAPTTRRLRYTLRDAAPRRPHGGCDTLHVAAMRRSQGGADARCTLLRCAAQTAALPAARYCGIRPVLTPWLRSCATLQRRQLQARRGGSDLADHALMSGCIFALGLHKKQTVLISLLIALISPVPRPIWRPARRAQVARVAIAADNAPPCGCESIDHALRRREATSATVACCGGCVENKRSENSCAEVGPATRRRGDAAVRASDR